jgi:hypothetical protein
VYIWEYAIASSVYLTIYRIVCDSGALLNDHVCNSKQQNMDKTTKGILWNQFGASIDMLINTISSCPDEYFITNKRFYYITFHSTLF